MHFPCNKNLKALSSSTIKNNWQWFHPYNRNVFDCDNTCFISKSMFLSRLLSIFLFPILCGITICGSFLTIAFVLTVISIAILTTF